MEPNTGFFSGLSVTQKLRFTAIKMCRRISSDLGKHDYFDKLYELNLLCKLNGAKLVQENGLYNIYLDNTHFQLRKGSSDIDVFVQVILKKEYQFIIDIIHKNGIPLRTMIDAGANIGLTSILFAKIFPELTIKAFEPDAANYVALQRNISINKLNGKIDPFQAGITPVTGWLIADDNKFLDNREWSRSFKVVAEPVKGEGTEGYAIHDILRQHEWDEIDFLKMDIEGGEEAIFDVGETYPHFLNKVNMIALEIHDTNTIRQRIYAILRENHFFLMEVGELTLGIKNKLLN
jgi:FkbM family methyltransferase